MQLDPKKLALVLSVVNCPNCGERFGSIPEKKNLANIRCEGCHLEARFVHLPADVEQPTLAITKKELVRIATKKIQLPAMIFYREWLSIEPEIHFEKASFYPFIPYLYLHSTRQPVYLTRKGEEVLVYMDLESLPSIELIAGPSDAEIAEIASVWDRLSTSAVQRIFNMGYARAAFIIDLAKVIRRSKGLPVDEPQSDDEEKEDE